MPKPTYSLFDLPAYVAAKVKIDQETGCWLWQGRLNPSGYGNCKWKRRQYMAHRLVWMLLIGPIPEGHMLDHLCRVRHCVFPGDLEPVTPEENNRRAGLSKRKATCRKGHPRTASISGERVCLECRREHLRRYRVMYPERFKEYDRRKRENHPGRSRRQRAARPGRDQGSLW